MSKYFKAHFYLFKAHKMESTVKDRLIKYLEEKKISKSEFGRRIGVSSAFITSMRQSMQPDKLERIALNFPDLNTEWLMTGKGYMIKGENSLMQTNYEDVKMIPLLPLTAQGGTLNDFIVSVKPDDCEKIVSPIKGAEFAMTVSGDSMEPEYPSGAKILLKKINEKAFIEWGRVYVLDTCNGSVIKKIMPGSTAEVVTCISLNQHYPPFEVAFGDMYGMYRVLMLMSEK